MYLFNVVVDGQQSGPQKASVVIADGHAVVRVGMKMVLGAEPDIDVLAETDDTPSTLRELRALRPDVLLLDLGMAGEDVVPELRDASPGTRILVLTPESEPAFARASLRTAVAGYLLKESPPEELIRAVRRVRAGETYPDPALGASLPEADDLSAREVEVLRLIALGYTNSEIARSLYISVRTVESHRAHIQRKLSLSSRADLVRYALSHGLMPTD